MRQYNDGIIKKAVANALPEYIDAEDKKFIPSGPFVAMLTPFTADGDINEHVLRCEVDFAINKGVSGLFPCGTSGEYIHLSQDQLFRIMDIVVGQADGRVPVIPGASSSCTANTLALAKHAKSLGCPAVVISPPYYIPLDQEGIKRYYQTILNEIDMNIVLYNIPAFTNELTLTLINELIKYDNIIAIKDSSANLKNIMHYIDFSNDLQKNFAVMTGTDDIILPALTAGCSGSMTALAGIIPEAIVGIYNSFASGDMENARKYQFSILKLIRLMESMPFPGGFKMGLSIRGFDMGPNKQVQIPALNTVEYDRICMNMKLLIQQILNNM